MNSATRTPSACRDQLAAYLRTSVHLDATNTTPRAWAYRIDTGSNAPARARVRLCSSGALRVRSHGIDAAAIRAALAL